MTMRITMIQARLGESGSVLAAGSTYTVSDGFGAEMVYQRFATDTDNALALPQRLGEPQIAATQSLVSGAWENQPVQRPYRFTAFGDSRSSFLSTSTQLAVTGSTTALNASRTLPWLVGYLGDAEAVANYGYPATLQ